MTVKELKEFLEKMPDSVIVYILKNSIPMELFSKNLYYGPFTQEEASVGCADLLIKSE